MNKSDYVDLLSQAIINDTSKFTPVSLQKTNNERPTSKTLPSPTAEGETPRICSTEDFAKPDCQLCLPRRLTPCPSLWTPKDTQRETINETYPICYWYIQLCPRQVA